MQRGSNRQRAPTPGPIRTASPIKSSPSPLRKASPSDSRTSPAMVQQAATVLLDQRGCSLGSPGPDSVPYRSTTQAGAAVQFISEHRGEIGLITVSIGGNDLLACSAPQIVISCATGAAKVAAKNLGVLLAGLHRAAGSGVPIVGTTYPRHLPRPLPVDQALQLRKLATLSLTEFRRIFNPRSMRELPRRRRSVRGRDRRDRRRTRHLPRTNERSAVSGPSRSLSPTSAGSPTTANSKTSTRSGRATPRHCTPDRGHALQSTLSSYGLGAPNQQRPGRGPGHSHALGGAPRGRRRPVALSRRGYRSGSSAGWSDRGAPGRPAGPPRCPKGAWRSCDEGHADG